MRCAIAILAALLVPGAGAAADKLSVVTTTEGLASIAREVGGAHVEVTPLSRGIQDPHFVDPNPTLVLKIRKADLLVDVGLDLEIGWLPGLVNAARNADVQPNGARRFTAASVVAVMEQPVGPVDRSLGDLHPGGNPHFLSDPRRATRVAEALAEKLATLDAPHAADYRKNFATWKTMLSAAELRWKAALEPLKGRKVITHHKTLSYFLDWAGITAVAYLEPKPGTPPPSSYLAGLVDLVKTERVGAVIVENYYDRKPADVLAKHAGVKVVVIPGDVGGIAEAKDYLSYVDALVARIAMPATSGTPSPR